MSVNNSWKTWVIGVLSSASVLGGTAWLASMHNQVQAVDNKASETAKEVEGVKKEVEGVSKQVGEVQKDVREIRDLIIKDQRERRLR